jgi:hypothetical protein
MIDHIAKRIAFIMLGYVAAVLASVAIRMGIALLLGYLLPATELWEWIGLNDIKYFSLDMIFIMMAAHALIFAIVPSAGLIALSEYFGWRGARVYMWGALLVVGMAVFSSPPHWIDNLTVTASIYCVIVMLSASIGGWTYWRIAGHRALGWEKDLPA